MMDAGGMAQFAKCFGFDLATTCTGPAGIMLMNSTRLSKTTPIAKNANLAKLLNFFISMSSKVTV